MIEPAFIPELRLHWRDILTEYFAMMSNTVPWPEADLYNGDWRVLGLFNFPYGERLPAADQCPITAGLIEKAPRHGAGGFSLLRPGTRIKPHCGYQGDYMRCHLGLVVPAGDCALKVGGEVLRWREGETLVFDDRGEHEAWNNTEYDRVVLLVDYVP